MKKKITLGVLALVVLLQTVAAAAPDSLLSNLVTDNYANYCDNGVFNYEQFNDVVKPGVKATVSANGANSFGEYSTAAGGSALSIGLAGFDFRVEIDMTNTKAAFNNLFNLTNAVIETKYSENAAELKNNINGSQITGTFTVVVDYDSQLAFTLPAKEDIDFKQNGLTPRNFVVDSITGDTNKFTVVFSVKGDSDTPLTINDIKNDITRLDNLVVIIPNVRATVSNVKLSAKVTMEGNTTFADVNTEGTAYTPYAKIDYVSGDAENEGHNVAEVMYTVSGGSLGGGGTSTPPSTTITPTVSEGTEVSATVSGESATISKLDTSKLEEGKKDVSVDMTGGKTAVSEVKISTSDVKAVDSLEVKLSTGTVVLDSESIEAISTEAKGTQIAVAVSEKAAEKLNDKQKEAVSDISLSKLVDVNATSNNTTIENLGNTKVTVPFELKEGELADTAKVWVVNENGEKELVEGKYNKADGTITFEAEASSTYALAVENEKDALILTIGENDMRAFGEVVNNDVAPEIVNDRTLLPIRIVTESFGAKVGWDNDTKTVSIKTDDVEIALVIGENYAIVNGEKVELDTAAYIKSERTYVPVRFIMETLDTVVDWNAEDRQVIITK